MIDGIIPRIRVIDLETAGNGLTDVCEIGWQDVVLGDNGLWTLTDERGAALVNPGRPISAETMAIHHIEDSDLVGAPFWKEIAPSVLRPEGGVVALAAHRAAFEQRYCTSRLTGDVPWICTWKCALRAWPHLSSFSNQMLRYQRRPRGLVREIGLPAHRAMPDAYVTAHHLRDLMNESNLDQLITWSREPGLLPRVRSGPYRGKTWEQIPNEALADLAKDRDVDLRFSAAAELQRRGAKTEQAAEIAAVQGRLI
ncbi:MAG: DNA polymerase III subunit epsilon [Pseudorhizobium sp.]